MVSKLRGGFARESPVIPAKTIRVVHLLHAFGAGGLEDVVASLVRNGSAGFEHIIVCFHRSGVAARRLPPDTRVIELGKTSGNSPGFLLRLARLLRSLEPDVVNTYNWAGMDGVLAAMLAGIRPVIQNEHGWGIDDPFGKSRKRRWVRWFLSHWIREFVCVSQQIQHWLRREVRVYPPVNQIYNGVDVAEYGPDLNRRKTVRAEQGFAEDAFVMGVVARLDPIKNHELLFRAFRKMRRTDSRAYLLVVGDGGERQALERLAGEGAIFLGERTDVPDILCSLDLFVLPSLNEGISMTILEAMLTGLPVVATRVGGNPELVDPGRTGLLVPSGDEVSLAEALLTYAGNPGLRREHGQAGRERVLDRFLIADMTRAYETLYSRVARFFRESE